jgi:hypothetical protein
VLFAPGPITAKALAVLEALLWGFHNARSGETRPGGWTISGKATPLPKIGLARNRIFGEYQVCETLNFPGFAGTPARLLGGFCVSGAVNLNESRCGIAARDRES